MAILKETNKSEDMHGEERSGDGWRTKQDLTALTETKKGKRDEMRLRVTEKQFWNILSSLC